MSSPKAIAVEPLTTTTTKSTSSSSSSTGSSSHPDVLYQELWKRKQLAAAAEKKKKKMKKQQEINNRRPRGRPESVAGAMNMSTLRKLQSSSSTFKRPRGRPRKQVVEEGLTTGMISSPLSNGIISQTQSSASDSSTTTTSTNSNTLPKGTSTTLFTDPPALQRYYRTELLTPMEEYSLGRKVQFMVQCEFVYEGLKLKSGTEPSIFEWAQACGFTTNHNHHWDESIPYIAQIRPQQPPSSQQGIPSNSIVVEQQSNFFVGNGVVADTGPGRGRGRVKKPPPLQLKPFYDDSILKFPQLLDSSQHDDQDEEEEDHDNVWKQRWKLGEKTFMNTGTPMEFVELMIVAKEAKQRMVQCNMRLVVSIAKRYKHVGVNIADLVQEGSIGLTRAAEKFDPGKGFKFSTYASWWIQQAVFRSIAYHSRTIRLPVHVHNLLNRVRRTRLTLQQELGRTPSDEEMAAQLQMSPQKYIKMLRLTRRAISLEKPKYQNNPKDIGQESEMLLGDTIDATTVIPDENTPEQSVDQGFFQDDLKEMLTILSTDERRVICARYGLEDGLTRTATAVAAKMKQSKSWVRSQECRALRKLRRPWYEKRLWEHQNSLTG